MGEAPSLDSNVRKFIFRAFAQGFACESSGPEGALPKWIRPRPGSESRPAFAKEEGHFSRESDVPFTEAKQKEKPPVKAGFSQDGFYWFFTGVSELWGRQAPVKSLGLVASDDN